MSDENIMDMSDDDVAYLSQAEAQKHIDRVIDAAGKDVAHPYSDGHNRLHRKYVDRMHKLHQIVNPQPEPQTNADGEEVVQQWPPHMVKIMSEALDGQAEKHNKLIDQAQNDMNFLVSEGFDRSPIPDDLQPYQANALKMQRLLIEGKHKEAGTLMKRELSELKAPLAQQQLFETFIHSTDLDGDLKETIATDILLWIQAARKAQKESYRDRY